MTTAWDSIAQVTLDIFTERLQYAFWNDLTNPMVGKFTICVGSNCVYCESIVKM